MSASDYRARQVSLLQDTLELEPTGEGDDAAAVKRKRSVGNRMMSFMSGAKRGSQGALEADADDTQWESVDASSLEKPGL